MRIHVRDLPSATLDLLQRAQRDGGMGPGSAFHRMALRWQTYLGLGALVAGLVTLAIFFAQLNSRDFWPWGGLALGTFSALCLLYAFAVIRDLALRKRQGLAPFILVTPTNLVRCWGAHHPIEIHRLKDATSFKTTHEYDQRQQHKGRRYTFTFERAIVDFVVPEASVIQALDTALEWARAKGRGEALPDLPGAQVPDFLPPGPEAQESFLARQLINPRSDFWAVVGGLLLIGLLIALVVSRR